MPPRRARTSNTGVKVTCPCCQRSLHPETVSKHLSGAVPVLYRASQQAAEDEENGAWCSLADARPVKRFRPLGGGDQLAQRQEEEADMDHDSSALTAASCASAAGPARILSPAPVVRVQSAPDGDELPLANNIRDELPINGNDDEYEAPQPDEDLVELAASRIQAMSWAGQTRYQQATVEDAPDEDEEVIPVDESPEDAAEDAEAWNRLFEEEEVAGGDEYVAISVWDELTESFIRAGLISGDDLTEDDLEILRPFALKVDEHMSGKTFEKLAFAFPQTKLSTWKNIQSHVARLSGFEPQLYHCCVDSCCAFTGPHASKAQCPYCKASRYNAQGKPRKLFVYLPITPRLKAFAANKKSARAMLYRAEEHIHNAGTITDVMDSRSYRRLLTQNVVVDGRVLEHKYFEDKRDVALGLSTDGFAPFKRRTKTAWPLILFNYNLPPDVRNHLTNILGLGVIPGPKKPVDFDSFLWPFVQEMLRLSVGVHAYDALSDSFFALRAYLIRVFGDIPAISMVMRMKGHNGACPCRMCSIAAIRIPDARATTHYVPLDRSNHPDVIGNADAVPVYDPAALPRRSHDQFMTQAREVQYASSGAESDRLAKTYGIKGIPVLSALSSLSFPDSFPYDFMHLIWENVVKNLMHLWAGTYKDLDEGSEQYQVRGPIWEEVGKATADSGSTIPYVFGPRPPNVASDKISWTADTRSFWFQYIAPVVLRGRFLHAKYYDHFIQLVRLITTCLQFEITEAEVEEVRTGFILWVQKYEDLYYQHEPSRLCACPLTIHALLHIADSILEAGPVWTAWAFPMERYCGFLQPAIRSRRFPYSSLNRFVLDNARLTHIKGIYDLHEVLSLRAPQRNKAMSIPGYDTFVLMPRHSTLKLERTLLDKIVSCLTLRFTATPAEVRSAVPEHVEQWSKLRILPEGDIIRAAEMENPGEDSRDASFVRYEMLVDKNARYRNRPVINEPRTFYGQLLHILVVDIKPIPTAVPPKATHSTLVLGVIRTCTIEDDHTVLDIHYYRNHGRLEVVDLTTIQCVVGRVKDRGRFAIIDRSGALARPEFVD